MTSTATRENTELMAHLLRRAGFGATRQELEQYLARGYEAVVDDLLTPSNPRICPTTSSAVTIRNNQSSGT